MCECECVCFLNHLSAVINGWLVNQMSDESDETVPLCVCVFNHFSRVADLSPVDHKHWGAYISE